MSESERATDRPAFLELRTGAAFGSIRVFNDLLDVALRAIGADESARHDLALGVAELVANVCEHEYPGAAGNPNEVVVRLDISNSELRLTVSSIGPRFNLDAAIENAQTHDPLAELDGSGLGLPLLLGLFDSVDHSYDETTGNHISLTKRRAPAA